MRDSPDPSHQQLTPKSMSLLLFLAIELLSLFLLYCCCLLFEFASHMSVLQQLLLFDFLSFLNKWIVTCWSSSLSIRFWMARYIFYLIICSSLYFILSLVYLLTAECGRRADCLTDACYFDSYFSYRHFYRTYLLLYSSSLFLSSYYRFLICFYCSSLRFSSIFSCYFFFFHI